MSQRTTGRPSKRQLPLGSPASRSQWPEPPGPPEEGDHHGDDDHHLHEFHWTALASAQGWEARFEQINLPVVSWVLIEELCPKIDLIVSQCVDGLCLRPGWTTGPLPTGLLRGAGDDRFGEFRGFWPTTDA